MAQWLECQIHDEEEVVGLVLAGAAVGEFSSPWSTFSVLTLVWVSVPP